MSFSALLMLGGLIFLIYAWLSSASGMVTGAASFVGIKQPTPTLTKQINHAIIADYLNQTQEPTQAPTKEPTQAPKKEPTHAPTQTPWIIEIIITATQEPTQAKTPTPQPVIHSPGLIPDGYEIIETIKAKMSYYWPPLCGSDADPDCWNCNSLEECDFVASGYTWHNQGVGRWLACPDRWDFGTKFLINGTVWQCMDRGSMIIEDNGAYWLDMLYPYMPYSYYWGQEINVHVITTP